AGAGRVRPQAGQEHVVVTRGVHVEVRDVPGRRGGRQRGHRRAGEALGGRAGHAGEHHVPHRAAPAADVAVRGVPLLLRDARHLPGDLGVGDVAAAGVAVAGRIELQAAVHVDPAERPGLGYRPAVAPGGRVDGQVLRRPPEVLGGVAGAVERVDGHVAVDGDVIRVLAQALDRGVVADVGLGAVGARLEQQRVPLGAELVELPGVEQVVQRRLDARAGHAGVEDVDVRPEVRRVGLAGAAGPGGASGGVDLELPQGVAVLGAAGGAVHADVPPGAGDRQGLGAAGAGGGGVDGGPGRVVGRRLDLEGLAVGGLPLQGDLADGLAAAQVHLEPLRVGEGA